MKTRFLHYQNCLFLNKDALGNLTDALATGWGEGRKRVARATTDSNHSLPVAANLLECQFNTPAPDPAWVADITYVPTTKGGVYLAVIVDLFSCRGVGWSMAEYLRTQLVLAALAAALGQRIPSASGLLSDCERACQSASDSYEQGLDKAGITCTMSRRGNCWASS